MNQPLNLKREPLDKTVRLRAENDKGEPAGMALAIPTQDGGSFMAVSYTHLTLPTIYSV